MLQNTGDFQTDPTPGQNKTDQSFATRKVCKVNKQRHAWRPVHTPSPLNGPSKQASATPHQDPPVFCRTRIPVTRLSIRAHHWKHCMPFPQRLKLIHHWLRHSIILLQHPDLTPPKTCHNAKHRPRKQSSGCWTLANLRMPFRLRGQTHTIKMVCAQSRRFAKGSMVFCLLTES